MDIISDGEFWTLGVIDGTRMVLMVLVARYSCWN